MLVSPPYSHLGIDGLVTGFRIAEGGLKVLVIQPLADGRQTDAAIDQLCGMTVTELMEGAGDPRTLCVGLPADLNALVAGGGLRKLSPRGLPQVMWIERNQRTKGWTRREQLPMWTPVFKGRFWSAARR